MPVFQNYNTFVKEDLHLLFCSSCLQIRVALKDWDEVIKFQQDLINAQHFDAAYIFRKLRLDKAFYFTAMPKLVCYSDCFFHNEKLCFIIHKIPQST